MFLCFSKFNQPYVTSNFHPDKIYLFATNSISHPSSTYIFTLYLHTKLYISMYPPRTLTITIALLYFFLNVS